MHTHAEQEYAKAIELYTEAIELNPYNAVFYANRSLAYMRCETFGLALSDSMNAIQIDANYLKAYYRRAAAQMSLGKFKNALQDLEYVSELQTLRSNRF